MTREKAARCSACHDLLSNSGNSARRDFVPRITTRNGLRPTSGRIRKAAPVTVALDVVTSTERRDEAHDSSVSLVRHVVLLLKLCCADGGHSTHRATVYRCPLTWWDPKILSCSSEWRKFELLFEMRRNRSTREVNFNSNFSVNTRSECPVNWYLSRICARVSLLRSRANLIKPR